MLIKVEDGMTITLNPEEIYIVVDSEERELKNIQSHSKKHITSITYNYEDEIDKWCVGIAINSVHKYYDFPTRKQAYSAFKTIRKWRYDYPTKN